MSIQEKYALTDEGMRNVKLGAVWTAASNLVVFGGVGALYLLMSELVAHLTEGAPLPNLLPYAAGLVAFAVALFVAEYWAYYYQYGVIYKESGRQRINLAERLRKLPLGFFGRRDLADLTETLMTDVKTTEHAYSHVLPELYGAYITLTVAAVCLFSFDWRLALASLWSCPVGARHPLRRAPRAPAHDGGHAHARPLPPRRTSRRRSSACARCAQPTRRSATSSTSMPTWTPRSARPPARRSPAASPSTAPRSCCAWALPPRCSWARRSCLEGSCTFMTLFAFLVVVRPHLRTLRPVPHAHRRALRGQDGPRRA